MKIRQIKSIVKNLIYISFCQCIFITCFELYTENNTFQEQNHINSFTKSRYIVFKYDLSAFVLIW